MTLYYYYYYCKERILLREAAVPIFNICFWRREADEGKECNPVLPSSRLWKVFSFSPPNSPMSKCLKTNLWREFLSLEGNCFKTFSAKIKIGATARGEMTRISPSGLVENAEFLQRLKSWNSLRSFLVNVRKKFFLGEIFLFPKVILSGIFSRLEI